MIFQMMAVYDAKARAFLVPFFVTHPDVAVRTLKTAANDPEHQVGKYPEDFSLWHLGTFDDDTATINMTTPAAQLCVAVQLKGATHVQQ